MAEASTEAAEDERRGQKEELCRQAMPKSSRSDWNGTVERQPCNVRRLRNRRLPIFTHARHLENSEDYREEYTIYFLSRTGCAKSCTHLFRTFSFPDPIFVLLWSDIFARPLSCYLL